MHEFSPSPTAEHAMSPILDHPLHSHLPSGDSSPHPSHHSAHHLAFSDPGAAMSGLGIESAGEFALPMHHGHPQAVPSNVRGKMGEERGSAPRSVPQGLSLAIPGQGWAGGQTGAGQGRGMGMPPGYGDGQSHQGYY